MAASCTSPTPDTPPPSRKALLHDLHVLCRAIKTPTPAGKAISIGIEDLDALLPNAGLERGAVHEWIGVNDFENGGPEQAARAPIAPRRKGEGAKGRSWSPPHTLMIHLARQALESAENGCDRLLWIGQAAWPHSPVFASHDAGRQRMLARSLFVRTPGPAERLWAADFALRSRTAAAVMIDGSGFDLAATRRLQLAAEAGGGALCLLARPGWERSVLSAATTRWLLTCCPSPTTTRRWTVELLRCKGMQPASHACAQRVWILERDHATRALRVAPDVRDRSGEAEARPRPAMRAG